jgi:hypothetical protein
MAGGNEPVFEPGVVMPAMPGGPGWQAGAGQSNARRNRHREPSTGSRLSPRKATTSFMPGTYSKKKFVSAAKTNAAGVDAPVLPQHALNYNELFPLPPKYAPLLPVRERNMWLAPPPAKIRCLTGLAAMFVANRTHSSRPKDHNRTASLDQAVKGISSSRRPM